MLKGNLIVGKNQSVVVHADSLHDLIKLAESKSLAEPGGAQKSGALRLRVDLAESETAPENLFDKNLPEIDATQTLRSNT